MNLIKEPKIAFCLFGGIGYKDKWPRSNEFLDPEICYKQYKYFNILKDNYDVFYHVWDNPYKDKIQNLYKPKKHICEPFKKFSVSTGSRSFSNWSRWYSTLKVNELKKEYEKENNIKYDYVFVTRFDIGFFTELNFKEYNPKYFWVGHDKNNLKKDKNYYSSRIPDYWFFSNSEKIDNFSQLFLNIEEHSKGGFDQHKTAKNMLDKLGYTNSIKYILNRDIDNALIRSVINKKDVWNNKNLWNYDNNIYTLKPEIKNEL